MFYSQWITNIDFGCGKTQKEATENALSIIKEWAIANNIEVVLYHNARGTYNHKLNRCISVVPQSNKLYMYKITISGGYTQFVETEEESLFGGKIKTSRPVKDSFRYFPTIRRIDYSSICSNSENYEILNERRK